jgi:hypothetical protein
MKHFLPFRLQAGRQAGQSHLSASIPSRNCTAALVRMSAISVVWFVKKDVLRAGSQHHIVFGFEGIAARHGF